MSVHVRYGYWAPQRGRGQTYSEGPFQGTGHAAEAKSTIKLITTGLTVSVSTEACAKSYASTSLAEGHAQGSRVWIAGAVRWRAETVACACAGDAVVIAAGLLSRAMISDTTGSTVHLIPELIRQLLVIPCHYRYQYLIFVLVGLLIGSTIDPNVSCYRQISSKSLYNIGT